MINHHPLLIQLRVGVKASKAFSDARRPIDYRFRVAVIKEYPKRLIAFEIFGAVRFSKAWFCQMA